ncbi:L,D-transpeptidase family protein [Litoribacter alkaliphilus]|uniref:L,D-transpeptidase family protein n=1 Tax=Litoribacter ruber TaxID=702568 RepID=A0AAP2CJD1_9BACT|nr:L,D-transpeptidase family protein [Litoribacter alkaliphilus]MBS9525257.1 L,D-transpeptidase family protein [Litoribacter alkaliphilus]
MNPKSFPLRLLYSVLAVAILIVIVKSCGYDALRKDFSDRFKKDMATLQQESSPYEDINLLNPAMISAIYEDDEEFVLPKWGNRNKVDAMIQAIRESENDGLRPEDYHLAAIDSLTAKVFDQKEVELEDEIKLELLLTDAYLLLSTHLSQGKTDRETIDPTWRAAGREARPELAAFVDSTIVNDNVLESLKSLTPKHREYINLKRGLKKYREFARQGGWQKVNFTATKLEKGMRHPDVSLLKERLNIESESADNEGDDLFDLKLEQKVKSFQELNGLTPDGVIGRGTMEALNIPVEDRIANIEANLERWRWLSDDLGKRYVKVNIANFEMQVVESDSIVFTSRAIVGKHYRQTPVFSARMNHLVFAPTWTVPPTILWNDVIPAVKKDPGYLSSKNMQVLTREGKVVDAKSIDWKNVTRSNFPYMIRQSPGKDNALGNVKFMFPNQNNVYIHDTPTRNLFVHTDRSFSSGCIRISKPMEFAQYLLQDKPEWTLDQMNRVIAQGKERTVFITDPIQVHLLYMTAWAESDGTVHFRKDIYSRDQPLLNALKQAPPRKGVL